ncbi:YjgP/YjgQ family permease [Prochlorococcus marinus XMU1410]|uniref:LptF/LptG family permease n=1 Tax=Prochlorococcus marinus TaxID=1219 RepID=UPI001ADAAD08|nr:LptF/LptG family permease [Prochlorococcus marinus]MBO8242524.1 YjgP/YjgQ family permease [Prochlorococcus marinus XMU1410]MBW3053662.1 permease [Prochlorococcus marinus str. MU1410]
MFGYIFKNFNSVKRVIPLIDKWLIAQLVPPLIFSISAFTVVSLSVGVMFDLIRKIVEFGLPFGLALKILFLKLPGFLVLSFPMSVLLSTLLTYGKLSSNSELLALRSIGIKTSRFIVPALIVSIFMTGITFFFNNSLVPYSNKLAEISMRDGLGKSTIIESGNDIFFPGYGSLIDPKTNKPSERNTYLTQIFFSRVVENKIMKNVTLLDFSRIGNKQVLSAKSASFDKENLRWIFKNGKIIYFSSDAQTSIVNFDTYFYPLGDGPLKVSEIQKDANDMTVSEAIAAKNIYESAGNIKEARKMKVRIQEKFTLPFACLVFGLIGSSLGSKSNLRSSRSQGFGLSVILILIYYVISFLFSSLGVKGVLSPIIAAWLPVMISLGAGIYLLRKSSSF